MGRVCLLTGGWKPDLHDFRRVGGLAISSRQAKGELRLQSHQSVGQYHVWGRLGGHQAGDEFAWTGDLIPRHDPGHQRMRSNRVRLKGARHHRVYDLVLGLHVRDFLGGGVHGCQPAMARAQSRA